MDESLEDIAYRCAESHLAELKDISALSVVEITDTDLSQAEVDTVISYCGKVADHLKHALDHVSIDEIVR